MIQHQTSTSTPGLGWWMTSATATSQLPDGNSRHADLQTEILISPSICNSISLSVQDTPGKEWLNRIDIACLCLSIYLTVSSHHSRLHAHPQRCCCKPPKQIVQHVTALYQLKDTTDISSMPTSIGTSHITLTNPLEYTPSIQTLTPRILHRLPPNLLRPRPQRQLRPNIPSHLIRELNTPGS